jgi:hypothetical protein
LNCSVGIDSLLFLYSMGSKSRQFPSNYYPLKKWESQSAFYVYNEVDELAN